MPATLSLLLALAVSASPAAAPPDSVALRALRHADGCFSRGRFDSCRVIAQPFTRPRAGLSPAMRARALTMTGAASGMLGHPPDCERDSRAAMELAFAAGDSATGRRAMRWLAFSHLARERWDRSAPLYRLLIDESEPRGEWGNVGYAHMGLAYEALLSGRLAEAREGYRRSMAAMRRAGDERALRQATLGLARVSSALGDYESERRILSRLLAGAERAGDVVLQGQLHNNLGVVEYSVGDPARALAHWRRALALRGRAGPGVTATPRTNVALALLELGRNEDAVAGLDSLAAECRAAGLHDEESAALLRIGVARRGQGRWVEAWAAHGRALSLLDSVGSRARANIATEASVTLVRMGRLDEARTLLERERPHFAATADLRAELDARLAELELWAGRPRAALALARAALAGALSNSSLPEYTVRPLAAEAWRALGVRDSALAHYTLAAEAWEAARRVPRDPEWRERRGLGGHAIYAGLARLLLAGRAGDPAAARDAFDRLQRFKARTLLERMAAPGRELAEGRPPATADGLMRALAPGELLLDYFDDPDSALVFAVDRDGVTAAWIPRGPALGEQVDLLGELFAEPDADPARAALRARAAAAMGARVYGGVVERVRAARAVALVPDGVLHRLPLEALPVPGESRALGAARAVWRMPSASLLVALRARGAHAPGRGVLALAAERDEAGRALSGATREVRALAARFRAVDARVVGAGEPPPTPSELAAFDVLHVAAHTAVDDQRPWNSGVYLDAGERGWLRAGAIADTPLRARLAVLSGCSSATGRSIAGEGVQGLTAAFLGAGVPTVVATLWPVDDRVAGRFAAAFYGRLGRGATAAAALREARLELASGRSPRAADWAGFVLVGDGATRVRLERRTPWTALAAATVALLAALGAALAARRAMRAGL